MTRITAQRATSRAQDSERHLRAALGQYATGVAVVTTIASDGRPVGMTINSFSSLSMDPPLILWCLRRHASRAAIFMSSDDFAINILSSNQSHLAKYFAVYDSRNLMAVHWLQGDHSLPLLHGIVAAFICRRLRVVDGGDHWILIGHVEEYEVAAGKSPLIFQDGRYFTLMQDAPIDDGAQPCACPPSRMISDRSDSLATAVASSNGKRRGGTA
jgi:flavin reductase (DIM6/NTAB) family NADH-FMN oxidoreductase RutF